jgi:hypothetical protein
MVLWIVLLVLGMVIWYAEPAKVSTRSDPPSSSIKTATITPTAEVVRARVVPYKNPNGKRMQEVLVDWKNIGETTIRAVDADIIPYDARGNRLDDNAYDDYAIYAVSDVDPGVAPGHTYREPRGSGFKLTLESGAAKRVEVRITETVELGAY